MKTRVINLLGPSGVGKSTLAAKVFAKLKDEGQSVELVQEYVKSWVWEGRTPDRFDELYIMAKQMRAETKLYGKVETIVTDRPVWLSEFYAQKLGNPLVQGLAARFYDACSDVAEHEFYWVEREKPFDPIGRWQTEEESKADGLLMAEMLKTAKLPGLRCASVLGG